MFYDKARTIEGASQRVQEDTIRFSRIMEGLGTSLISSIMVLIEYFPLLMGLAIGIPIMWFGDWEYGLVTAAFIWGCWWNCTYDYPCMGFKTCWYRI